MKGRLPDRVRMGKEEVKVESEIMEVLRSKDACGGFFAMANATDPFRLIVNNPVPPLGMGGRFRSSTFSAGFVLLSSSLLFLSSLSSLWLFSSSTTLPTPPTPFFSLSVLDVALLGAKLERWLLAWVNDRRSVVE